MKNKENKNKTPRAAVLKYDQEKNEAPVLVASGKGEMARKIIAKAKEHDIPMQEDPLLVQSLLTLDIGTQIPPELFQVVAEVLVLVQRANESR